ncbi:MAG: L-threonylcarbamoyladenylate synthase [Verrucomicrobia bacterium]|nr:L-threonylcarbamoyladenylate synthase [Verrucomicrobiota bacterium]
MPKIKPALFRPTPANLTRLANQLRRGGIVGVPAETVYGLAANALDATACARIFKAKGRPANDPLIVHLARAADIGNVALTNPAAERLAEAFWPGPLTLVLPKKPCVPDLVTSGRNTVAVRVPAHPVFRRLIKACGFPLAAPSANPFGYISPTCAAHVRDSLGNTELRAILDGGDCTIGVESTILDLSDPAHPRLLRPGGLALEKIESVLQQKVLGPKKSGKLTLGSSAPAPGMLPQHYSPHTPVRLHPALSLKNIQRIPANEAIVLLLRPRQKTLLTPNVFWLSEAGQLASIARNLFGQLRQLDQGAWLKIHVELPTSNEGLAPAIRDRLTRAAAKV